MLALTPSPLNSSPRCGDEASRALPEFVEKSRASERPSVRRPAGLLEAAASAMLDAPLRP